MKKEELLSTTELAQILGISRIAVYRKIKDGKIKAMKMFAVRMSRFCIAISICDCLPQTR